MVVAGAGEAGTAVDGSGATADAVEAAVTAVTAMAAADCPEYLGLAASALSLEESEITLRGAALDLTPWRVEGRSAWTCAGKDPSRASIVSAVVSTAGRWKDRSIL